MPDFGYRVGDTVKFKSNVNNGYGGCQGRVERIYVYNAVYPDEYAIAVVWDDGVGPGFTEVVSGVLELVQPSKGPW